MPQDQHPQGRCGKSTEAPRSIRSTTHADADAAEPHAAAVRHAAPAATGADRRFPASLRMVALMMAAMVHIAAAPNQA